MKSNNPSRLSGGLIRVLKHSRVAWYNDPLGTTAYYEQPSLDAPGSVFVNGRCITRLVVDRDGFYADFPSPKVQQILRSHGVSLEGGWSCPIETYGQEINEAIHQSPYYAVRHHDGHISVQCVDQERAVILIDGTPRWTIKIAIAYRALAEMGISPQEGWYPVQQNLLQQRQGR